MCTWHAEKISLLPPSVQKQHVSDRGTFIAISSRVIRSFHSHRFGANGSQWYLSISRQTNSSISTYFVGGPDKCFRLSGLELPASVCDLRDTAASWYYVLHPTAPICGIFVIRSVEPLSTLVVVVIVAAIIECSEALSPVQLPPMLSACPPLPNSAIRQEYAGLSLFSIKEGFVRISITSTSASVHHPNDQVPSDF
ncbi:hypothetical protein SISSUDRAFT_1042146 [Sistotremastrum suecicum HHB10207 ss-3]|uniref:Uncharacterized protein n=1 Tax=Sistotremastrum suecicum HHB10207 ss-3 TaxID=1314776 RepID=A0A166GQQ0_9AGAM|nr:hypothetical protein SISSUDRAFT_1042146 [Sistotremastrum suecicum HHB10207 ss-3]